MKEEEDMESMKNGVTPQLPWAEGKAWGDSSVAGLGRQTVWVGARGWTAAGEYLGGEGRKEEMREKTEHLVGLTTESPHAHRRAGRSSGEPCGVLVRSASSGARRPHRTSHRRICDPRQGTLPPSLRFRSNEDGHSTSPMAPSSALNELTDPVLRPVPGTWRAPDKVSCPNDGGAGREETGVAGKGEKRHIGDRNGVC